MARLRRFDLDELSARPGTYFNPATEILIIVDDSAHPGAQLADDLDDGDWILVGDEVPLDDARRDELLERLEVRALVESRNARRMARGEAPLDVEAEVSRRLRGR